MFKVSDRVIWRWEHKYTGTIVEINDVDAKTGAISFLVKWDDRPVNRQIDWFDLTDIIPFQEGNNIMKDLCSK